MAVNIKDKYYTPQWLIEKQIKKTIEIVGKENITEIIEPAAGDGAYIEKLSEAFKDTSIYLYDLYPEHPQIEQQNFLELKRPYKKGRLIIGNPPYGTSSSLWKGFCKKSAGIGDYISFISPASQYNSNYYFKEGVLVYSELLEDVEFAGSKVEGGKNTKVKTCLNIYKVYDRDDEVDPRDEKIKNIMKFVRIYRDDGPEFEYYLAGMTSGIKTWGRLCNRKDFYVTFGITVLDESMRPKILEFLNQFHIYMKEVQNLKSGPPFIDNKIFLEKAKVYLYPNEDLDFTQVTKPIKVKRELYPKRLF